MLHPALSVELVTGATAFDRLDDATFVGEWEGLRAACSWATAFQSFAFVDCWYRLYESQFEPVVVTGRDRDGHLVGLLTLARERAGRVLVGAGDVHAEYQTWLCAEDATEPFMSGAIDLLEEAFPGGRLHFNFLSRGTPVAWVDDDRRWLPRVQVRALGGGTLDLSDPTHIDASLHKGYNRSKLNRLRRLGGVELETIDTVDGLSDVMDEISVLCDLRQGAVNDALPFTDDPLKRPLHLGLMERGLLHATVLRAGSRMASVHLDLKNGREVLLYLLAHAPALARQSPGSLHILLLARQLADSGWARYDLSPGAGYKDRFATQRELGPPDDGPVRYRGSAPRPSVRVGEGRGDDGIVHRRAHATIRVGPGASIGRAWFAAQRPVCSGDTRPRRHRRAAPSGDAEPIRIGAARRGSPRGSAWL